MTVTETPTGSNVFWDERNGSFIYTNVHGFAVSPASFLVTIPNLNYVAHYTTGPLLSLTTDPPQHSDYGWNSQSAAPRTVAVNPGGTVKSPPTLSSQ